ncbi:MAG: hypothetical protein QUS33_12095, partial [Dehalococcoidia bacterium]|nr:hypothetical protein [Dehalococcoidia bacterium]
MRCPRCQKTSLIGARYCVWCGTALFPEGDVPGGPLPETESLSAMREHLSEVAMRLSRVEGRVTLISERLGLDALGVRPVAG